VGLILLDTSAVVGYLDRGDALHESALAAIGGLARDRHFFAASAITWSELLVGVALGHLDDPGVRLLFSDLAIEVLPVDAAVAARAALVRADAPLRLPDALILATAELREDTVAVVTGDRHWGRVEGLSTAVVVLEERGS
jgi:predicted nucleic acid-binding protein